MLKPPLDTLSGSKVPIEPPRTPGFNSARLRDAKKRNPLNLYNGQGTNVRFKDGHKELQSSGLVEIPKN